MLKIDATIGDGNSLIISDATGQQLLRTVGDCVNVADREYFIEAMKGNTYISDIQVSKSTGSRICTFAIPVYGTDGSTIVGIAQRNYDLSDFHNLIAEEVTEDKQEIVIVDRQGDVIAHSSHEIDPENPESQAQNPFYTDSRGETYSGYYESTWMGDTWMISWIKEPTSGWVVANCRVRGVALASTMQTTLILIVSGTIFFFIALVISILFSSRIAKPIQSASDSILNLSSGDLTGDMDGSVTGRKDEIGLIGGSGQTLTDKLREVIGKTKDMATNLKNSGENLAGSAQQATDASGQVSSAVEDISRGSVSQAESVQTAAQNTETIGTSIDAVAGDVGSLNAAAREMQESCDSVLNAMNELIGQSGEVTKSVSRIGDVINSTNDSANEISKFTETIQDIAAQTNLLSLNASIEAARAGEMGKDFAVVAGEIGSLAKQSADSATQIKEIVDKLLADAAESVTVMEELNKNFEAQSEKLNETKDNMGSMGEKVATVSTSADNIESRVEELNRAKDTLVGIIEDLSAISEENAASTQQTNASMEELNATFTTINEAAGDLRSLAENLSEMISYFKTE